MKPREFWLYGSCEKENTVIGFCEAPSKDSDLLHVIEYQAYDKLRQEAEKLAGAIGSNLYPVSQQAAEALASYRKSFPKEES